jgi:RNAse (barnase) inhibitor barstar
MSRKTILFDANRFSTLASFYQEVENTCTKDLGWSIGRNLDAFNDVLWGGFGVHDYEEPVQLIWLHSDKSRQDLGWTETINYLTAKLTTGPSSTAASANRDLVLAETHTGKTLFEIIVDIIKEHGHIELYLK